MPTETRVKPRQRGTPEEHLRYMLRYGLKWTDGAGVAAAAEALLPHLGSFRCPRQESEPDCRPGACDCDGARDALSHALALARQDSATGATVPA